MQSVFKALSDATRVSVVERLAHGEQAVGDLARPFDMALPSFMQHLRVLENAGLITSRKVGRTRFCRLEPNVLKSAEHWLNTQRTIWTNRLESMD